MQYLFPISYMSIVQSMAALVIGLAVVGKPEMAAEISIVHGATLATFYAFSANFRNIILYGRGQITLPIILFFRLALVVPLAIVASVLCIYLAGSNISIALVLILRRCIEWINEVHLCETEVKKDYKFSICFLSLQIVLFFSVLGLSIINETAMLVGLYIWALVPGLMSLRFVLSKSIPPFNQFRKSLPILLPHFGSTAIIGFSFYVFRLIIYLLVDKSIAGDLFAAITVGSFMGSIYGNVVGPSVALHEMRTGVKYSPHFVKIILYGIFLSGVILVALSYAHVSTLETTGKDYFFWMTTGFSLIGGVIMVKAINIKLLFLEDYEEMDVFGPDMLIHVLLIAAIPCLYFIYGVKALSVLYLLNAILVFIFYSSAKRYIKGGNQSLKQSKFETITRICIAVFLFFPIFFQLSGKIFYSPHIVVDSGGLIFQLPLPISIIGCYMGLLFMGTYRKAYLSLTTIFFLFLLMIFTLIIVSNRQIADERYKLLLLFQYMLPVFALVLGQLFENGFPEKLILEKAFLWVLAVIIPVQLFLTWNSGKVILANSILFFSVYQLKQYVVLLMVCGYLISLYALWKLQTYRKVLILLAPLVGIYAVAGTSILSFFFIVTGLFVFAIYRYIKYRDKKIVIVSICSFVLTFGYFYISFRHGEIAQKYSFLKESQKVLLTNNGSTNEVTKNVLPRGLNRRFEDWNLYGTSIIESKTAFFLGHKKPFERSVTTSAHNFYLDFVYNFGFIALLPILFLIGYTVRLCWKNRRTVMQSEKLLGLSLVVFFLLVIDNNFKVTLRQPYPGIMTFFIWGVLLTRLRTQISQK